MSNLHSLLRLWYYKQKTEKFAMDKILLERLRNKYVKNPPEGMTPDDIKHMSDSDLLDMDYFLNEDDDDDFGEEGFYIF